jgi:hypothetical protein
MLLFSITIGQTTVSTSHFFRCNFVLGYRACADAFFNNTLVEVVEFTVFYRI